MPVLFLLAALASIYFVARKKVETAFLAVYLPALLLLPNEYAVRIPHLPSLSVAQAALVPIGLVACFRFLRAGLPAAQDLLVLAFMVSLTISEVFREWIRNDGILLSVSFFISIFMAYMVGRNLIEPNLRIPTVRRFVFLILLLGPMCLLELRLQQNFYGMIAERFLGSFQMGVAVQLRAGLGRATGAFNDAEIAGIIFAMTFGLNSWLVYLRKSESTPDSSTFWGTLQKYHVPGLLLVAYLLATQSRGPIIAFGVALLILQVLRFADPKVAMIVVAILIAVGGFGVYEFFQIYITSVLNPTSVLTEQLSSAVYRRLMNERYVPIVERGGWLGWGYLHHPSLPGLNSIDNEYLLIHLAQGQIGYLIFLLIAAVNVLTLSTRSWVLRMKTDRAFVVCLLAAMSVFWLSVYTVYMGEQLPQIAFLLIGWSQSALENSRNAAPPAKFSFKRVYS
jgi:hypothetical protein